MKFNKLYEALNPIEDLKDLKANQPLVADSESHVKSEADLMPINSEEAPEAIIGKTLVITAVQQELGVTYPFKTGDKVVVTRFVGYQGNDREYEITADGRKATILFTQIGLK